MGGLTGTIFIDHLSEPLQNYKIGHKAMARVISVETTSKKICLSLLSNLITWNQGIAQDMKAYEIGRVYENS